MPVQRVGVSDKEIVKALYVLAKWFNTTQYGLAARKATVGAAEVLVRQFGYLPHKGPYFRAFKLAKDSKLPAKGSRVRLPTGLHSVQSWAGNYESARAFRGHLGNESPVVIVRLLSPAIELLNTDWIRQILAKLSKSTNPSMKVAVSELRSTIRKKGAWDDEDEVILEIDGAAQVEIMDVWEQYRRT